MRARRGGLTGERVAAQLSVSPNTYYRLERGEHRPSVDTALQVARWLRWTVERVLAAAAQAPPPS
jgi:DNA-binding XRE family transcriptional regulator